MSKLRYVFIFTLLSLSGCVSQPLPEEFRGSDDFDTVEAAKTRISLGLTYLKNGNYSQAKFNLDKALQFAPRLADAHYSMAYYFQVVGENELAEKSYQEALDRAPRNPDIANTYGAFLCEHGKYEKAKTYFLKAVNSNNYVSTAETFENLALCSQSQGHINDAIDYLKQAINHQPSRGKSLLLLTQLLMSEERWTEAKTAIRRYEKTARISADTLWMSYKIEKELGNHTIAAGYGDMLVRMYPKHQNTKQYLLKRYRKEPKVAAQTAALPEAKTVEPQVEEIAEQLPAPIPEKEAAAKLPAPISKEEVATQLPAPVIEKEVATQLPAPISEVEVAKQLPAPVIEEEVATQLPAPISEVEVAKQLPAPVIEEKVATQLPAPISKEEVVTQLPAVGKGVTEPMASEQVVDSPVEPPVVSAPKMDSPVSEQAQNTTDKVTEMGGDSKEVSVTEVAQDSEMTKDRMDQAIDMPDVDKTQKIVTHHIVKDNENLYRISLLYNVKLKRLVEWNQLEDASSIYVGKKLIVVDPQTVE